MAGLSGMSGTGSMNSRFDITNRYVDVNGDDYSAYVNRREEEEKLKQLYEDKGTLDFQDMLQLMVAQFQNQTIDDQASTSDMMNQLVSMSTMQAMNQMVDSMGELQLASVMSYAASLVDKEVTVGVWKDDIVINEDGTISKVRRLEEICEKVVGMGTYGGQQVIFLEKSGMFYLSDILAVGKLPPKVEHAEDCEDPNCKGECMDPTGDGEEPELPEDTEVKIPDKLDPDFNQGEAPEVKEPDNLDPGYGVGGKDDD